MKKNILGILVLTIAVICAIVLMNRTTPFEAVQIFRDNNNTQEHTLIDIEEVEGGLMLYSVAKVNNGEDNMYFSDMVEKSLMGYTWLGGGGHINKGIFQDEFLFSAQLLNENQNVRPTIMGICLNEEIEKITLISNGLSKSANFLSGKDENERLYYIPLSEPVSKNNNFIFLVEYSSGSSSKYDVLEEDIEEFQKGGLIEYFMEE
jgi:hypothetical protein